MEADQIGAEEVGQGRILDPRGVGGRAGGDGALELLDVAEVALHVGAEGGVDGEAADLPGRGGWEGGEDVEAGVGGHSGDDGGAVVVLLDALVVVREGPVRCGVDVEEVGAAVVAGVVDHGGEEEREDGGRLEQRGRAGLADKVVQRLEDIGGVGGAVVRHVLIELFDET